MRFDAVHPLDLTHAELSAWLTLQEEEPALQSPFLSPRWAQACAGVDGPDRRSGRVVVIRDEDGAPAGFLPMRMTRPAARPMGAPLCDYQAMVARPGLEVDPRALVEGLPIARFDFSHLIESQAAFRPFMRGTSDSQVVDLSSGYDAYAETRRAAGSEVLKDAARKRRKLEKDRGAVTFTAESRSAQDFETLIDWKRRQYRATRQTDIFDAGWPHELLRSLFAMTEAEFGARLFTLHAGGELAAAHLALRGGPVLHAWFIAHDAEFARYSPGVILIDHILRWQSDQGMRELDLGPGDYRFKLQLANATRQVAHGFVGGRSAAAIVREAQYSVRSVAEALPLGRVSAWPGKAMRRVDLVNGLK